MTTVMMPPHPRESQPQNKNKEQVNPYARAGPTIHRPYVQRLENGGGAALASQPLKLQ